MARRSSAPCAARGSTIPAPRRSPSTPMARARPGPARGVRSEVDAGTLVHDPGKTIEEGAVLPWNSGGRRLSMYAAGQLGVRLDVPYRSLTARERDIVLHGEPVRQQVTLSGRNGR